MKTIHLIASSLLLSAAMFTSCKKSAYNTDPGQPAASITKEDPTSANRLQFSSGFLNTSYMAISGNGQMLYESRDARRTDLFMPLRQADIPIQAPNQLNNVQIKMIGGKDQAVPVLYLRGNVKMDDDFFIPVEFILNPATIDVNIQQLRLMENTSMLDLMNVAQSRLGANISQEMWEKARNADGSAITISDKQNTGIYRLLLGDLNEMLHMTFATNPNPHSDNGFSSVANYTDK